MPHPLSFAPELVKVPVSHAARPVLPDAFLLPLFPQNECGQQAVWNHALKDMGQHACACSVAS